MKYVFYFRKCDLFIVFHFSKRNILLFDNIVVGTFLIVVSNATGILCFTNSKIRLSVAMTTGGT